MPDEVDEMTKSPTIVGTGCQAQKPAMGDPERMSPSKDHGVNSTGGSDDFLGDQNGLANDRILGQTECMDREPHQQVLVSAPLRRALLNKHRMRTSSDSDTHRIRAGADSDTTRGRTTRRAYRKRTHSLNLSKGIVGQKK